MPPTTSRTVFYPEETVIAAILAAFADAPGVEEGLLPEPSAIRASAALALMYLETGFVECPACGEEVETKTLDAAYELRDALGATTTPSDLVSREAAANEITDALKLLDNVTATDSTADDLGCAELALQRALAALRSMPGEA